MGTVSRRSSGACVGGRTAEPQPSTKLNDFRFIYAVTEVTSLNKRYRPTIVSGGVMSERSKAWAVGLVCLVLLQTAASLLSRRSFGLVALSDVLQCVLLLSAALSCLPGIIKNTGRTRLFWMLMTLGLTSWLSYQFSWTYVEVVQRREVPSLFTLDVVLFLHIVPMMAALALQPDVEQHDRDLRLGSLDFALLLLWWFYLYVYTVIPWQYVYPSEAAYGRNLNSSYLAEKLAMLAGLALLWSRSSGLWKTIYAHWFGASFLYSMSSYVANWALARKTYYSGSLYDLPLVVSIAWMTVPGLLALKMPPEHARSTRSLPRGVWAARLGMVAVFSLPVFAYISVFDSAIPSQVRTFRLVLTLGAMMLMGAMVFLKQHFLDIELIQLLRASRQSFEELQLLQTQLVQSEKLASLGQLVGGAAHELNNPLTAMLGYSELLSTTELSPEQRNLADKAAQQAKRVRSLVASLLSFAKQVPAAKSSLDVNTILQTALKLCQPQMQVARVQYTTEMGDSLPRVHCDSNQLLQVFSHIINNAVHAMSDSGGTLSVTTGTNGKLVTAQFADTGPGMLEPDRVFDPFYTTRAVGQGTGLGLSACYGIIQEHGGKITCRNRNEGGAVFLIELPAVGNGVENLKAQHAQAHAAK
jgi:signal transduction histidine kinase